MKTEYFICSSEGSILVTSLEKERVCYGIVEIDSEDSMLKDIYNVYLDLKFAGFDRMLRNNIDVLNPLTLDLWST